MDRKLAAILFSDIAGFTQLTAGDEEKAVDLINHQRELFQPIVSEFDGDWLKEIGDGLLLSFTSSKKAINCAIKLQEKAKNIDNLDIRIGLHQGDVIISDNDVLGDDVNIAARIEPISAIGGIAVSEKIVMDLSSSPEYSFKMLGLPELKGVNQQVKVFSLSSHSMPVPKIKFSVQENETSSKSFSSIFSILATIVFTLIVFYSYPYIMPYFQSDQYSTLKINHIDMDIKNKDEQRSLITALKHGIEKKIIDDGRINLITSNQSQASLLTNKSRYLSLNAIIKENLENVEVSFTLNEPDGTIFDRYIKEYTSTNLNVIASTLINLIPVWTNRIMSIDRETGVLLSDKDIQSDYPMEYYELLGMLNSQEKNNIQNAIIKLDELDITDDAKWIDLMMAEAYTLGFIDNRSESFLNAAKKILEKNNFSNSIDIGYASYIRSLINFSQDSIDEALADIKQAIKNNQSEKRYKEFHYTLRSMKLKRMTIHE